MRLDLVTPSFLFCTVLLVVAGCSTPDPRDPPSEHRDAGEMPALLDMPDSTSQPDATRPLTGDMAPADLLAHVTEVKVSGASGAYTFAVTLRSSDTGCEHYADWWEVLTPEGELLYRRILAHSHVDEQPFTRSGGPIDADSGQRVIVRAHMNKAGYGGAAMQVTLGDPSIAEPVQLATDFAAGVARQAPQPNGCAF